MSLPEVNEVRHRIESCKRKDIQMFLKAEYLFGARAIEIAGKLTPSDNIFGNLKNPIGPTCHDVLLAETQPPDIPQKDLATILITAFSGDKNKALEKIQKLTSNIPVGIFKIRIAKQHQDQGEEIPFRLFALPLVNEYEPWAKEIYNYFKSSQGTYIFPFSRQDVWYYITEKDKIFDGLTYRIKKYVYHNSRTLEEDIHTVLSHQHPLKNQGLRHIRTHELITDYGFDGLDLGASIGWSMSTSQSVSASPVQTATYAEIREAWKRYIKKLCKTRTF
jgi:hypothetical protein